MIITYKFVRLKDVTMLKLITIKILAKNGFADVAKTGQNDTPSGTIAQVYCDPLTAVVV